VIGEKITLIDTGAAVARELQRRIETELVEADAIATTHHDRFFTSGELQNATRIMSILWGQPVTVEMLPLAYR